MSPHLRSRCLIGFAALTFTSLVLPNASQAATAAASETVTGGALAFINASPTAVTFRRPR